MFIFMICSVLAVVGRAKEGPYLPSPPGTRPNCIPMGTTYCEEIDGYPEDIISKLLSKSNGTFVFSDESKGLQHPPSHLVLGRSLARGSFQFLRVTRSVSCEDNPLCPVQIRTVYPKAAIDQTGSWKFVNKVPVLTKLCGRTKDGKQKGLQKYALKKLPALDEYGKIKDGWFVFPSCCNCSFVD